VKSVRFGRYLSCWSKSLCESRTWAVGTVTGFQLLSRDFSLSSTETCVITSVFFSFTSGTIGFYSGSFLSFEGELRWDEGILISCCFTCLTYPMCEIFDTSSSVNSLYKCFLF